MKLSFSIALFAANTFSRNSISSVMGNEFGCVDPSDYPSNHDFFPDKAVPKYSEYWDISYHKSYKILRNIDANTSYLLYQCGTEIPTSEEGKHDGTFAVPLQDGVAITSTTILPHFEQLNMRRQINAVFMDPYWINSPCISTLIDDQAITAVYGVGYYSEPYTSGVYDQMRRSDFLSEHPDTVVIQNSDSEEENIFVFSEDAEQSNHAIYEWHKVIGALFNKEALANANVDATSARYECVKENAASMLADSISSVKPTVAWAYWTNWSGIPYWDVARCDQKINYYCEFAEACSAELLHSNNGTVANPYYYGEGSDYHMTDEEFFAFAKDADVLIYPNSNFEEVYQIFRSELDEFKSIQNQAVYDTTKSGAGAWYEQRLTEYDVVLQDFCSVVGLGSPNHERNYFRKIFPSGAEVEGNLGVCTEEQVDQTWVSRASECVVESSASFLLSWSSTVAALAIATWSYMIL